MGSTFRTSSRTNDLDVRRLQCPWPVDKDIEREARAGAELQSAHAGLATIVKDHFPDAAHCGQIAGSSFQSGKAEFSPVKVHLITQPLSTAMVCPVTNNESGPHKKETTAATSSGLPRRLLASCKGLVKCDKEIRRRGVKFVS
jgi:hypothetical protein